MDVGVRRDDGAALTGGDVLLQLETEGPRVTDRAHRPPPVADPAGLGGVLQDPDAVLTGDGQDGVHVGGGVVQVDGHDREGPLGDELLPRRRVEGERVVDVGEDGDAARGDDGVDAADEGGRRHDDLTALGYPQADQGAGQGGGAGGHADRVGCLVQGGEPLLEPLDAALERGTVVPEQGAALQHVQCGGLLLLAPQGEAAQRLVAQRRGLGQGCSHEFVSGAVQRADVAR